MIMKALFKEFGRQDFVTTIEVNNVRICISETIKLHSIRRTPRDIAIKFVSFIINLRTSCTIRYG